MTICTNCQHFLRRGRVWYDQFCAADKKPLVMDPVSGEMMFEGINSLGQRYLTNEPHPYARDINVDGQCPLYTMVEIEQPHVIRGKA